MEGKLLTESLQCKSALLLGTHWLYIATRRQLSETSLGCRLRISCDRERHTEETMTYPAKTTQNQQPQNILMRNADSVHIALAQATAASQHILKRKNREKWGEHKGYKN